MASGDSGPFVLCRGTASEPAAMHFLAPESIHSGRNHKVWNASLLNTLAGAAFSVLIDPRRLRDSEVGGPLSNVHIYLIHLNN